MAKYVIKKQVNPDNERTMWVAYDETGMGISNTVTFTSAEDCERMLRNILNNPPKIVEELEI